MQIQDKVQNWNQGMTREALILAKANGTLRSLGASDEEISAIIEKFKDPEADSMGYLMDTLIGYRIWLRIITRRLLIGKHFGWQKRRW